MLEAEQNVQAAQMNNGITANIFGPFGLTNAAQELGSAYSNPDDYETVRLGIRIPILDWGKRNATIEIARANRSFGRYRSTEHH